MLGYAVGDVLRMQKMIEHAANYARDSKDDEVVSGCAEAIDLLEGLLAEGWVQ